MQKSINSINIRKASAITALILTAGLFFASCKKDDANSASTSVSDEEVAEAVTESVSASSGGMVTQTEASAGMAATTNLSCGGSSDTTVSGQNVSGASITYDYVLTFSRSLICTDGIPSQYNANFTGSNNYQAALMSSVDNSNAQLMVTGLQPSAAAYVVNTSYTRNGTQQSKVRLQRSITSNITITASDINVSKSTKKIVSGTATVQFSGSASGGASVSRGGTITFNGSNSATLKLNNGGTYNLQW